MKSIRTTVALTLVLLILFPLLPVYAEKVSGPAPRVTVWLKSVGLRDTATLTLDGSYSAVTSEGTELLFHKGAVVSIVLREGKLWLFVKEISMSLGTSVRFVQLSSDKLSTEGLRFTSGGNLYPGDLQIDIKDGVLRPILTISVEDYLKGVVPYEMSNSFPLEALKAQAVCARTYALSHINGTDEYNLVDNTNDQVFKGIYFGNENAIRAVNETAGIVGSYKGKLATCYYSASNGGQTELPENVWSTRGKLGYYAMVNDPYDLENPESVTKTAHLKKNGNDLPQAFLQLLHTAVLTAINNQGFDADPENFRVTALESISLGGHTLGEKNTYVSKMTVTFRWAGRKWIKASSSGSGNDDYDLSQLLGGGTPAPTADPSGARLSGFTDAEKSATVTLSLFPDVVQAFSLLISGTSNERITLEERGTEYLLMGRRFGHGVGMSQRGAQWMAGKYGMTFVQILNFYYPHMDLSRVASGAQNAPTARP